MKAEVSEHFVEYLKTREDLRRGVEVGIAEGLHCAWILEEVPHVTRLYGVDPHKEWINHEYCGDPNNKPQKVQDIRADKCAGMTNERFTYIRAESPGAADFFEDGALDFVFIDAQHHYQGVKADIEAWTPKVRKGGIIAGHDIDHEGVKRAVEEAFPKSEILGRYIWVVLL
jgi:predicted O-methyltransferase YrrM